MQVCRYFWYRLLNKLVICHLWYKISSFFKKGHPETVKLWTLIYGVKIFPFCFINRYAWMSLIWQDWTGMDKIRQDWTKSDRNEHDWTGILKNGNYIFKIEILSLKLVSNFLSPFLPLCINVITVGRWVFYLRYFKGERDMKKETS